jgi:hypothetical protein
MYRHGSPRTSFHKKVDWKPVRPSKYQGRISSGLQDILIYTTYVRKWKLKNSEILINLISSWYTLLGWFNNVLDFVPSSLFSLLFSFKDKIRDHYLIIILLSVGWRRGEFPTLRSSSLSPSRGVDWRGLTLYSYRLDANCHFTQEVFIP